MQKSKLYFILMASLLLISLPAQSEAEPVVSKSAIKVFFQRKFESIEAFLSQKEVIIDSERLMEFVEQELMTVWSAELTIKAILGVKRWSRLKNEQKQQLIESYNHTMKRYLYEVMLKYEGQKAIAEKIQLNKKATKGWLTAKLLLKNFPDITIDLKLFHSKAEKGKWLIYDFRFQGISFIKLKQSEYRTIVDEQGVLALIELLDHKNNEFFVEI